MAVITLFSLGNASDAFILLRLSDLGVAAVWIPLLWSALHVVKMTSSVIGGALSDRFGRRAMIAIGYLWYAAIYASFAWFTTLPAVIAAFLAYGLYFGLTEGVEKAWVADMAPAGARGTAFGIYNAALGFGGLAASLLFGAIWTRVSPTAAFFTGASLALAASLLLYLLVSDAKILVTNDDGVHSEGIHALAAALRPPRRRPRRRAAHRSERDRARADASPPAADGTAPRGRLRDRRHADRLRQHRDHEALSGLPDLVVSGINKGYNLGDDVTYSGTVSGALEGALLGVPSIAVSLARSPDSYDFGHAAAAAAVAALVLRGGFAPRTFLSLNVPAGKPKGFSSPSRRSGTTSPSSTSAATRAASRYWIEEGENDWEPHDRSDFQAVRDGTSRSRRCSLT